MADTAAKLELIASVRDQMTKTFRAMQTGAVKFVDGIRKKFTEWAKDLFSLKGLIASVTAFLTGRAIINATQNIAQVAAETARWADRLGVTVEQLDQLEFAGSQFGVSADGIRDGLKTLQEKLTDAADGSAILRKRLQDLGISGFDQVTGRVKNAADLIQDLSAAFARMKAEGQGAELFKISNDLFGGQAGGLQTLLSQGPVAVATATELARQVGLMTGAEARAGVLVSAAFNLADRAIRSVKLALLEAFGPDIVAALRSFAELVSDNREKIVEFVKDVAKLAVTALKTAAQITITIVRGVLDAIDFVRKQIDKVTSGLQFAFDLFTKGPYVAIGRAGAGASETDAARQQINQLEQDAHSAGRTFDDFVSKYVERFSYFRTGAENAMLAVASDAEASAQRTTSAWDAYFLGFGEGFRAWRDELKEFNASGVQAGREAFQSVQTGLQNFIDSAIKGTERFKDAWKAMVRSILDDWISTFSKLASQSILSGIFSGFGLFGGSSGPRIPGGGPGGLSGITPGGGGPLSSLGGGGGQGPIVLNLQIQAIDARGIDELLVSRRSTIVGVVRDGLRNDQQLKTMVRRR